MMTTGLTQRTDATQSRPYQDAEADSGGRKVRRRGGAAGQLHPLSPIPEDLLNAFGAQEIFFSSPVLSPNWTSRISMRLSMETQRLFSGVSFE